MFILIYSVQYKYLLFYQFIDDDTEKMEAADSSDSVSDTESERDESDTSQNKSEIE